MVADPNLNIYNQRIGFDDYQRLQEEFDLKKAAANQAAQINAMQMQKFQKELATPDLEGMAQSALYGYYQGQPLSPEGRAAIETLGAMKGSTVQYKPDASGRVMAVTEPNPYQMFLAGAGHGGAAPVNFGADPMAASQAAIAQRQSQIGSNPYQDFTPAEPSFQDVVNLTQGAGGGEQGLGANSPALKMSGAKKTDLSKMTGGATIDQVMGMKPQDYKALLAGVPDAGPNTIQLAQEEAVKNAAKMQDPEILLKNKKASVDLQEAEKAAKEADRQAIQTKNVATQKIMDALSAIKGTFSSGFGATAALALPGKATSADTLGSIYDTLKSNISLDKLMEMKKASPNGASGLGALSQNELKMLTDRIAALDVELPMSVQVENLKFIAKTLDLKIPEFNSQQTDVKSLIEKYAD